MSHTSYETVQEKAARLSGNYRVILINSLQALVIGDHDTYKVESKAGRWACDCKWGQYGGRHRPCSHVLATLTARQHPASQGPVARLAELVQAGMRSA